MKKLIYRADGKLTKFAFWTTFIAILLAVYFLFGGLIGLVQDKYCR